MNEIKWRWSGTDLYVGNVYVGYVDKYSGTEENPVRAKVRYDADEWGIIGEYKSILAAKKAVDKEFAKTDLCRYIHSRQILIKE
jgi:2-hydroxy-3-keto-5-methylthiopentenyl-1-phosphate phosphatase